MAKLLLVVLVFTFTTLSVAVADTRQSSCTQDWLAPSIVKNIQCSRCNPMNNGRCRVNCEVKFLGCLDSGSPDMRIPSKGGWLNVPRSDQITVRVYAMRFGKNPGDKYEKWIEIPNAVEFENVSGEDVVSAEADKIVLRLKDKGISENEPYGIRPCFTADMVAKKRLPLKHNIYLKYEFSGQEVYDVGTDVHFYRNLTGSVKIKPNQKNMVVNGKKVSLNTPAVQKRGITYLPAIAVAKAFGCEVNRVWVSTKKSPVVGTLTLGTPDGKEINIYAFKDTSCYSTYWESRIGKKIPYNRIINIEDCKIRVLKECYDMVISPVPIYAVRDSINKLEFMVPAQTLAKALGVSVKWDGKQIILSASQVIKRRIDK